MPGENYILLERTELNASAIEDKLFDFARNGNRDAYAMLGYVLDRTETEEGCWTLNGNLASGNYTNITLNRVRGRAHRMLMQMLAESIIPMDKDVDHMCHNESAAKGECKGGDSCRHRACFNPNHLRITSRSVNISNGYRAYWNQATCPSGHIRNMQNTRFDTYDRPFCWECRKIGNKLFKREQRRKAKLNG
jgi:hypothetical protein